jgi:replicative DNA helicase
MMLQKKIPWQSEKAGFEEAVEYLKGRALGSIQSMRTPWNSFNSATVDGLEWSSMTVIAGRPASGKTAILQHLIRDAMEINSTQRMRVLNFQLEMPKRALAIREYSAATGLSYKQLCSASGGKLTVEDFEKIAAYTERRIKYPIDVVDDSCSVNDFRDTVNNYMATHKTEKGYTNTLITIDHSILLKQESYERDKTAMLYNLGETLTSLKKKYPIAFVVLSQLNREAEDPTRNEEGKYGNYVLESDIFGGDALLQHADTVVGVKRPLKYNIKIYGPEKYIINDRDIMAFHFLKCRNGETGIAWFKGDFGRMQVVETDTPPQQERKYIKSK